MTPVYITRLSQFVVFNNVMICASVSWNVYYYYYFWICTQVHIRL